VPRIGLAEKLRVTKGADSSMVIGEADGHHATHCGTCFSPLYWTGYERKIRVPYGSLLDEPALKPMARMFVGSKAPWYGEVVDPCRGARYCVACLIP